MDFTELTYLAFHDPLTELLNRTWLYKHLDTLEYKYIYFIDINNLYSFNKRGHICGDNHLLHCVSEIKNIVHDHGYFIRYGGDEFIVFSNISQLLHSTKLYTVGFAFFKDDVYSTIHEADINMIKQKSRNGWKNFLEFLSLNFDRC